MAAKSQSPRYKDLLLLVERSYAGRSEVVSPELVNLTFIDGLLNSKDSEISSTNGLVSFQDGIAKLSELYSDHTIIGLLTDENQVDLRACVVAKRILDFDPNFSQEVLKKLIQTPELVIDVKSLQIPKTALLRELMPPKKSDAKEGDPEREKLKKLSEGLNGVSYTDSEINEMVKNGVFTTAFGANDYYYSLAVGEKFSANGINYLEETTPSKPIINIILARPEEGEQLQGEVNPSAQHLYSVVDDTSEHKYPQSLLAMITDSCSAYCRFCFRKDLLNDITEKALKDLVTKINAGNVKGNEIDGRLEEIITMQKIENFPKEEVLQKLRTITQGSLDETLKYREFTDGLIDFTSDYLHFKQASKDADKIYDYINSYNNIFLEGKDFKEIDGRTYYKMTEIVFSGGDPMVLPNEALYKFMSAAAEAGISTVRIGSKDFAFRPQRFDDNFIEMLKIFHENYPDTNINFHPHFSTPDEFLKRDVEGNFIKKGNNYEWLPAPLDAIKKLNSSGFVTIEPNGVMLKGVNENPDHLRIMFQELEHVGAKMKYMYICRNVMGKGAYSNTLLDNWREFNKANKGLDGSQKPKLIMTIPDGKTEVIGVFNTPDAETLAPLSESARKAVLDMYGDGGLMLVKRHHSTLPHYISGDSKENYTGELMLLKVPKNATWFTECEVLYDGKKQSLTEQYAGLINCLNQHTDGQKTKNTRPTIVGDWVREKNPIIADAIDEIGKIIGIRQEARELKSTKLGNLLRPYSKVVASNVDRVGIFLGLDRF